MTRRNILKNFQKSIMWSLVSAKRQPSLENAYLVKGYEYVSIITTKIDRPLLEKFREFGVKMISTRTVGTITLTWRRLRAARNTREQRILFAGMCGGLYDDAYFDVDPKNETDHAEGGDQ